MLSAQLSINNFMPVEFKGKGVVGCKDQRRGISGPLKKKIIQFLPDTTTEQVTEHSKKITGSPLIIFT